MAWKLLQNRVTTLGNFKIEILVNRKNYILSQMQKLQ